MSNPLFNSNKQNGGENISINCPFLLLISGFTDGTYRPNQPVTRGQMAIFLNKAFTLTTGQVNSFNDVSSNMAAYQSILNVSANGIASGYSDGTYRPEQQVTRGQFSAFMARTLEPSFRILPTILKLEVSGLEDGLETNDRTHRLSVKTDEGATVTVTLNGEKIDGENNVYEIKFSKEGKNAVHVTSDLKGIKSEKQIEVTYNAGNLSTSEIAKLNDKKVVLIKVNNRSGASQGSGIIVGNGLILTNEHVINGMSGGTIKLNDGTEYEIEGIVISDKTKDLALLKTTEEILNVDPVDIGTYTSLAKGDKIVAIGSPLGLQNTVSEGIVSSFRLMEGVQKIQISAPIDHGSSGGGLFNSKGELVGVTASGYNSSADLNFAVAIDEASIWYNYFNMEFEDIKVVPFEDTTSVPVFDNIALGMTKEQVKNIETAKLYNETSNRLSYRNKLVFDFSANVSYEFENNKLVAINVFHDVVNDQGDLDLLETYFVVMYDNLSKIYGEPTVLDTNWYDDDDGYTLSAFWLTNDNNILLTSRIQADYSSFGGIRISIK